MADLIRNHYESLDDGIFLNPNKRDLSFEFGITKHYGDVQNFYSMHCSHSGPEFSRTMVLICMAMQLDKLILHGINLIKKYERLIADPSNAILIIKTFVHRPEFAIAILGDKLYQRNAITTLAILSRSNTQRDIYTFGGYPSVGRLNRDITQQIEYFVQMNDDPNKKIMVGEFIGNFSDRFYFYDYTELQASSRWHILNPEDVIKKLKIFYGYRLVIAFQRFITTDEVRTRVFQEYNIIQLDTGVCLYCDYKFTLPLMDDPKNASKRIYTPCVDKILCVTSLGTI